jgi:predicted ester cyclase
MKEIDMSEIREQAMRFFDACETGKGWEGCKAFCHADATFSAQATALANVDTLAGYAEWMKNLLTPIPDGRYELRCFGVDEERECVAAYAVFHGTQTGPGGPVDPTGKTVAADYVYAMAFEKGLIRHMTKIWNDTVSLQQLGWA